MPRPVAVKAQPSAATALLNQAVAQHQAGRLDEAATLYAKVLASAPGHFDATHLLGVVALQRGDLAGRSGRSPRRWRSSPRIPRP